MNLAWRANFQAYSLFIVKMADCSAAQRYAKVSSSIPVLTVFSAMRSLPRCAGLDLARLQERPYPSVNDHHLGPDRIPWKGSQFLF